MVRHRNQGASSRLPARTRMRRSSGPLRFPPNVREPRVASRSALCGFSRPALSPVSQALLGMDEARRAAESVFRQESGRIIASLIRISGSFDRAEEAMQEAFASALASWPQKGLPRNPAAWILTAAHRKLIDSTRRERRGRLPRSGPSGHKPRRTEFLAEAPPGTGIVSAPPGLARCIQPHHGPRSALWRA